MKFVLSSDLVVLSKDVFYLKWSLVHSVLHTDCHIVAGI